MTWTKLSDDFNDRVDLLGLTRSARLLYVEGLVWCNRTRQDGKVPRAALSRFTDADPDLEVAELERAGVWIPVEGEDAWQMDWSDQETAAVGAIRAQAKKERQQRWREGRERAIRHDAGDHTFCSDSSRCQTSSRHVMRDETGNETRLTTRRETTPRPDPSRPVPKETGTGLRCIHKQPIAADGSGCKDCGPVAVVGSVTDVAGATDKPAAQ